MQHQNRNRRPQHHRRPKPKPQRPQVFEVLIFDTFSAAKLGEETIREKLSRCDQVNVVIREEGNMDDPDLLGIHNKVKVYAGAAWTSIHERRIKDGWYDNENNPKTGD